MSTPARPTCAIRVRMTTYSPLANTLVYVAHVYNMKCTCVVLVCKCKTRARNPVHHVCGRICCTLAHLSATCLRMHVHTNTRGKLCNTCFQAQQGRTWRMPRAPPRASHLWPTACRWTRPTGLQAVEDEDCSNIIYIECAELCPYPQRRKLS